MRYGDAERALRALWPRVGPYEVASTLSEWSAVEPGPADALLAEVSALPPADAATRLMPAIAARLEPTPPRDRHIVLHALDALVRAGGDPTSILGVPAQALLERRTAGPAATALRRAALRGWPLDGVREPVERCESTEPPVGHVKRLLALQDHGEHAAIRTLCGIYDASVIGNLHEGLGVLEARLLAGDAGARQALAEAAAAGADLFRQWEAMLPVWVDALGTDAREAAARAIGQLQHVTGETRIPPDEALQSALPRLGVAIGPLCARLSDRSRAAEAAARTLQSLVAQGASLAGHESEVEAALSDARVAVRHPCSVALTAFLEREGREEPLPAGFSRRPIHAVGPTPLPDERPTRCGHCGGEAHVVYKHEDISQTHADILIESRCSVCGLYEESRYGY